MNDEKITIPTLAAWNAAALDADAAWNAARAAWDVEAQEMNKGEF